MVLLSRNRDSLFDTFKKLGHSFIIVGSNVIISNEIV